MRARLVGLILVVGCGHAAPAQQQQERDPVAAARKYRAVADAECPRAPPNGDACCKALSHEAHALMAQGQREAGLAAYDEALHKCSAHAGLRASRHFDRHPDTANGGDFVATNVLLDYGFHLKDDVKLLLHAAYVDGLREWTEGQFAVGTHYVEVEVYVAPRAGGPITRHAAERSFVITRDLTREKRVAAPLTATVRDSGPEASGERVRIELEGSPVKPAMSLAEVGALLRQSEEKAGQPPAPPPDPRSQQLLPPKVGVSLIDPSSSRELAEDSRDIYGWLLVKVCVKLDGTVQSVSLIHTSSGALTGPAFDMIRKWRYRPYLQNGAPYPFCHPMRFEQAPPGR